MHVRVNLPRLRALLGAVVVLAGSALSAQAPQQGTTITGTVVADDTKEPIAEARIVLVSGNNFATTNGEGRYTLRNLTAGRHEIRVLRVGYLEQKVLVTVVAGANTVQNFSLATAVVKLQQVVTTATGEVRRVELGNSVSTMNVSACLEESPVRSLGDLLAAKAPGVQVLPAAARRRTVPTTSARKTSRTLRS